MSAELRCFTVDITTVRWSATVLTGVDLRVAGGQITALLGGPGAGKTMIASALTGRLPAAARCQGQVVIGGEMVGDRHWPQLQGRVVGYVPQDGVDAFDPHRRWVRNCAACSVAIAPGASSARVWMSLRAYADAGAAVLVVSNEVGRMIDGGFTDQMVLVHEGRILAAGSTKYLLDCDPHVQALWRASR